MQLRYPYAMKRTWATNIRPSKQLGIQQELAEIVQEYAIDLAQYQLECGSKLGAGVIFADYLSSSDSIELFYVPQAELRNFPQNSSVIALQERVSESNPQTEAIVMMRQGKHSAIFTLQLKQRSKPAPAKGFGKP